LLVAQFSLTASSDWNVLVTVTATLEKVPLALVGTPAGVRLLHRSTPLSTRHSLMKTGCEAKKPAPPTVRLAELGRFVGVGLTLSETPGVSADAIPTPAMSPAATMTTSPRRTAGGRRSSFRAGLPSRPVMTTRSRTRRMSQPGYRPGVRSTEMPTRLRGG
jgi:hypothetical protein